MVIRGVLDTPFAIFNISFCLCRTAHGPYFTSGAHRARGDQKKEKDSFMFVWRTSLAHFFLHFPD